MEPGYARQRKEDGFPRAEKRIGAFVGEVHAVFKTTHSGDRQKETVYVFDQAAVMRFLQMVREKMTR